MSKFFISCDEATCICDKSQYGEAGIGEKIRITIHMIVCKKCKCYNVQNSILTKIYKNHSDEICQREDCCLSDKDKEKMENELKEKMEL